MDAGTSVKEIDDSHCQVSQIPDPQCLWCFFNGIAKRLSQSLLFIFPNPFSYFFSFFHSVHLSMEQILESFVCSFHDLHTIMLSSI